ncbi:MAG TPA: DNA repair protein RecN [Bacillota bacterium]|nr:DNA repair protein RecN [Bacillota bacterium]HPF42407.1 DNA repair protein RecN [Bacillota bacterium]HPJ85380.1 DNA repair protein RecN [Bacillota bacterium]
MLEYLLVENFAIIDRVEIGFKPGMTVLTGETGAGKSILIDAISLLLGDRASQDMIRSGCESAKVTGRFRIKNADTKRQIIAMGISMEDETIEISREITNSNRNMSRINNVSVTLQQLKAVSIRLADIHSQFDTQRLINPQNYLALVDGYRREAIGTYLEKYRQDLAGFQKTVRDLSLLLEETRKYEEKRDLYIFQLNELTEAGLDPEEKRELQESRTLMKNFDKVYESLAEIKQRFDDEPVLEGLAGILENLDRLSDYSEEYKNLRERMADHYYEIKDIAEECILKLDQLNFDPNSLDKIETRLYLLDKLEEKYKMTIPELCEYRDRLEKLSGGSFERMEEIRDLERKKEEEKKSLIQSAGDLSKLRKDAAKQITAELGILFGDLSLANTRFEIRFADIPDNPDNFGQDGIDSIDFFISTNPGEPLRELSKTASGGEMSRVMLAFKTIFIRTEHLETMVFDEIDTGISGVVASQIARKIREISENCQVLSITHIPQVVAVAANHLKVEKKITGNRTTASAGYLDFDNRVKEIAMMISGDKVTENALENARELLLEN